MKSDGVRDEFKIFAFVRLRTRFLADEIVVSPVSADERLVSWLGESDVEFDDSELGGVWLVWVVQRSCACCGRR